MTAYIVGRLRFLPVLEAQGYFCAKMQKYVSDPSSESLRAEELQYELRMWIY